MNMLKSGEIDLMGDISYTEERSNFHALSELPMGEDKYYLYVNSFWYGYFSSDLTTLNGKRIGVLPDTLSARRFCEWEKSHGVDTQQVDITSTDDARQKLQNQEIDGFCFKWIFTGKSTTFPQHFWSAVPIIILRSAKMPGSERGAGSGNAEDRKENPFIKKIFIKGIFSKSHWNSYGWGAELAGTAWSSQDWISEKGCGCQSWECRVRGTDRNS